MFISAIQEWLSWGSLVFIELWLCASSCRYIFQNGSRRPPAVGAPPCFIQKRPLPPKHTNIHPPALLMAASVEVSWPCIDNPFSDSENTVCQRPFVTWLSCTIPWRKCYGWVCSNENASSIHTLVINKGKNLLFCRLFEYWPLNGILSSLSGKYWFRKRFAIAKICFFAPVSTWKKPSVETSSQHGISLSMCSNPVRWLDWPIFCLRYLSKISARLLGL